jgi:oligopeptide/dipeptide ABC transporter ATP-binding protein
MYAGRIVEHGPARETLLRPLHPYTAALLHAVPRMDDDLARLPAIEGVVPRLDALPQGCAFAPRCGFAEEACRIAPPPMLGEPGHQAACIRLAAVPA